MHLLFFKSENTDVFIVNLMTHEGHGQLTIVHYFVGKSLRAKILITSPTSSLPNEVTLNFKFISHPICDSAADNLKLMLQQSYEYDIQENSASSLSLGVISSTFELLQRCKDPIKVVCRVTEGKEN